MKWRHGGLMSVCVWGGGEREPIAESHPPAAVRHAQAHARTLACTGTHKNTQAHVHTHKHTRTYMHAHTHAHTHTLTHSYTHTHTHSRTHTHPHMHTLAHTHALSCLGARPHPSGRAQSTPAQPGPRLSPPPFPTPAPFAPSHPEHRRWGGRGTPTCGVGHGRAWGQPRRTHRIQHFQLVHRKRMSLWKACLKSSFDIV